jgi:DNA primase
MAGRIPQEFIDELLNRVDIVDVIDERVPLKKAGREYKACCPFHGEKTPSFTVSPGKQFYHCFGCGAHGTALGFLMEYAHMDFPEAVEALAARVGLEVPRTGGDAPRQDTLNPLYEILLQASDYYRQQLKQSSAKPAWDYLQQRGLSKDVTDAFKVGYAPAGWDNLLKAMGSSQERRQLLLAAGLVVDKVNKTYDRFRQRIMFPIRDRRGRVIAFGGRVISPDDSPKYLNSPETAVFHKGRELYGLYEARQALRDLPRILVVEGYMDVVALAQFDIRYAVATLGTATTPDHLETLFRTTEQVVFCFDGDRAGRQAAWRALENALPAMREGRQISFLFLAEGEDPDSYVRARGKQALEQLIQQAQPLSEYLINSLAKQVDLHSPEGRSKLVELARPLLAKLPQGLYRDLLLEQLAGRAHMQAAQLQRYLSADLRPATHSRPAQRQTSERSRPSPVRTAIALLLHQPSLHQHCQEIDWLASLDLPGIALLRELIELLQHNPHLGTAAILERFRDNEHGPHLAKLARQEMPELDETAMAREFSDALALLHREQRETRLRELEQKADRGQLDETEKVEFNQLHRYLAQKTN